MLDSLPNELLITIAGLCEREDLSNLSLVSKWLWHPFQRELLKDICVRLGSTSMSACKQFSAKVECLVENERILSYILRFELSNIARSTNPDLTTTFTTAMNALPRMSVLARLCFRYIIFSTSMVDRLCDFAHKQTIHLELHGCDYPTTYSFPHRLRVSSLLLLHNHRHCLPFLQGLILASRWYLNTLSANSTPGNTMTYVSHIPIFPLPTSAPLQRLVKVDIRRTASIKDADIIIFLRQNPTIEQLHLPLQRALRPLPVDILPQLHQLWGSLDAIRNLVPGRPVSEAVVTHVEVNSFVLSVQGVLDALKRSTASIGLFAFYQMTEGLSLDEQGTLYASIVEVMPRVENLHVGVDLEVRRAHQDLECPYPLIAL
jgi:hypothetical protein